MEPREIMNKEFSYEGVLDIEEAITDALNAANIPEGSYPSVRVTVELLDE